MKSFIKDLIIFDVKYKHIPLITLCVLYIFSPIDLLPEFSTKYWYSYIDDILLLIGTGVAIYIDKGDVFNVQESNKMEKSNDNSDMWNNSSNVNNTDSVQSNSNTDNTTNNSNNDSEYSIPFEDTESTTGDTESNSEDTDNTKYTESEKPRDIEEYINELKQSVRTREYIVESGSNLW